MPKFPIPLSLFFLFACFLLASCSSPTGSRTKSTYGDKAGPQGFSTVVLDAGHGGRDSGAKVRGQMEKTLVLDITKKIKAELTPQFKVVMVRDSDVFVELNDRVAKANRYSDAVLVSVHLNHGPRRIAGSETYYWRTDSYSLAKRIQRNLSAAISGERGNRGLVRRRLRLTRNPEIPSVLLECGYLTNPQEAAKLGNASYRSKLAKAIAKGIKDQAAHGDAGMGPLPKPIYMPPSKASDRRDSL